MKVDFSSASGRSIIVMSVAPEHLWVDVDRSMLRRDP